MLCGGRWIISGDDFSVKDAPANRTYTQGVIQLLLLPCIGIPCKMYSDAFWEGWFIPYSPCCLGKDPLLWSVHGGQNTQLRAQTKVCGPTPVNLLQFCSQNFYNYCQRYVHKEGIQICAHMFGGYFPSQNFSVPCELWFLVNLSNYNENPSYNSVDSYEFWNLIIMPIWKICMLLFKPQSQCVKIIQSHIFFFI